MDIRLLLLNEMNNIHNLVSVVIALGFIVLSAGFFKLYKENRSGIDLFIGIGFIITAIGTIVFSLFIDDGYIENLWKFEMSRIEYVYALIVSLPFIGLVCKALKATQYKYLCLFIIAFMNYAVVPIFIHEVSTPYSYGPQYGTNGGLEILYEIIFMCSIVLILKYHKNETEQDKDVCECSNETSSHKSIFIGCVAFVIMALAFVLSITYTESIRGYENTYYSVEGTVEFVDDNGYILISNEDILKFTEEKIYGYGLIFHLTDHGVEKIQQYANENPGKTFSININESSIATITIYGAQESIHIYGPENEISDDSSSSSGGFSKKEFTTIVELLHTK